MDDLFSARSKNNSNSAGAISTSIAGGAPPTSNSSNVHFGLPSSGHLRFPAPASSTIPTIPSSLPSSCAERSAATPPPFPPAIAIQRPTSPTIVRAKKTVRFEQDDGEGNSGGAMPLSTCTLSQSSRLRSSVPLTARRRYQRRNSKTPAMLMQSSMSTISATQASPSQSPSRSSPSGRTLSSCASFSSSEVKPSTSTCTTSGEIERALLGMMESTSITSKSEANTSEDFDMSGEREQQFEAECSNKRRKVGGWSTCSSFSSYVARNS